MTRRLQSTWLCLRCISLVLGSWFELQGADEDCESVDDGGGDDQGSGRQDCLP